MTLWRVLSDHSSAKVLARCTGCNRCFVRSRWKIKVTRGCLACTRVPIKLRGSRAAP